MMSHCMMLMSCSINPWLLLIRAAVVEYTGGRGTLLGTLAPIEFNCKDPLEFEHIYILLNLMLDPLPRTHCI